MYPENQNKLSRSDNIMEREKVLEVNLSRKRKRESSESDSERTNKNCRKVDPKVRLRKQRNSTRVRTGICRRELSEYKKSKSLNKGDSRKRKVKEPKEYSRKRKFKEPKEYSRKRKFEEPKEYSRKRKFEEPKDDSRKRKLEEPKEFFKKCYWLPCKKNARPNSKYCSDDCGINVATLRVKLILPEKLENWNKTPSIAEKKSKEELLVIQKKITDAQQRLESLEKKRLDLEQFIESVSLIEYDPEEPKKLNLFDKSGPLVPCVICTIGVTTKNYVKHVERCYNKCEKLMTFESKIPTKVPNGGNPICDFFTAETGSYCKRLKVLCPERGHQPASTTNSQDIVGICGAPMAEDQYELDLEKVCRTFKKDCNQHRFWEKYRRAEIDVQKVSAWLELESMLEKEKSCLTNIEERGGGVAGLLMHYTTCHEPSEDKDVQQCQTEEKEWYYDISDSD